MTVSVISQPGLLFVVAILCILTTESKYTTERCVIPDEHDLLMLLLENGGVVFASPPTDKTINASAPDDMHCPIGEKLPKDAPQNERARCPWKMVSTHDAMRYPSALSVAVPRCGSCLSADGSTVVPGTRCEVVDYPTKVLRQKGCENPGGVMQYGVEPFNMPVASRCVWEPSQVA